MIQVEIEVVGLEETIERVKATIEKTAEIAARAAAEYFIGDENHGLAHYPYYKYVNRQAGFGAAGDFVESDTGRYVPPGFHSSRQHRFVMAMIKEGKITPGVENRSGNLGASWEIQGQGIDLLLVNNAPYSTYVQGDWQTQMHNLIGWRRYWEIIDTNRRGAFLAAQKAVDEWLTNVSY